MPIAVEMIINDNFLKLPDIGPFDPPGSFTDYTPDSPRLVVVSCNPFDNGGSVWETGVDNQILLAGGLVRVLTEDRDSMHLAAEIEDSGSYQRDILTRRGLGRLTLQHYVPTLKNSAPATAQVAPQHPSTPKPAH